MAATDHIGEHGVCEGCPGITQTRIHGVRCIRASKNKKKKHNKQNSRALQKSPKTAKTGNNVKIVGKNRKRKQKNITNNTALRDNVTKPEARKKQAKTAKNYEERGTFAEKICHNKTVQKLEQPKWFKKK